MFSWKQDGKERLEIAESPNGKEKLEFLDEIAKHFDHPANEGEVTHHTNNFLQVGLNDERDEKFWELIVSFEDYEEDESSEPTRWGSRRVPIGFNEDDKSSWIDAIVIRHVRLKEQIKSLFSLG